MLPHRSDTSRGHLHPRRVATPRPFPSRRPFFPDLPFLSISRPISSIQRGCFSPVRPLMPPLSWGALARKPPFFPSQASLLPGTNPPPAIFNPRLLPPPPSFSSFRPLLPRLVRLTEADATMAIVPARQISTRSRLFRNTISEESFFCTRENLLISFLPSC